MPVVARFSQYFANDSEEEVCLCGCLSVPSATTLVAIISSGFTIVELSLSVLLFLLGWHWMYIFLIPILEILRGVALYFWFKAAKEYERRPDISTKTTICTAAAAFAILLGGLLILKMANGLPADPFQLLLVIVFIGDGVFSGCYGWCIASLVQSKGRVAHDVERRANSDMAEYAERKGREDFLKQQRESRGGL